MWEPKQFVRLLCLLFATEIGCSYDDLETEAANLNPGGGGWEQNDAIWDEKTAQLAPATSPLWLAPAQGPGTFNALNNIVFDPSNAPSPCAVTAAVDVHGSRVNGGEATAPNLWLRDEGRYLAPGESTKFSATMRNDAGWSKPVTVEATRMNDLRAAGLEEHHIPIFDVVLRDAHCQATPLGKVQIGPVPSLATNPLTHFVPATYSFGLFQTYWGSQRAAIISKILVNAMFLVAMGDEPDDFYEGCYTHLPVPSREVLFEAAYALSAMVWVEAAGNPLVSTGVLMTARGQPVRLHVLYEGEPVCFRQLFPGERVERIAPPGALDVSFNPTAIDVVQFSGRSLLPGELATSAAHYGLQGYDTRRESAYLLSSSNMNKYTFKSRRDARIVNARIAGRNGRVDHWNDVVARLATPVGIEQRAGLLATASTVPSGAPPGYLEQPMDTTWSTDFCGNLVCGPNEPGSCPSDCVPPPLTTSNNTATPVPMGPDIDAGMPVPESWPLPVPQPAR